jgi:hypothetical protein
MRFFYNTEEASWLPNPHLRTYMVSIPHAKEEQWTFSFQTYLDINCIPCLDRASVNESYYEDAPVKPTASKTTTTTNTTTTAPPSTDSTEKTEEKPAEEKKVEKVKKEKSTVCIVKSVEINFGLPQNVLDTIVQREANQENDDKQLRIAINKRNEVENFIYSTRSKLDSELVNFVTSQDKELLLQLMQTMENWLYSGDEEVYSKSVLDTRGKDLNDLGGKIYKRYHDWGKLSDDLNHLENKINLYVGQLNNEYEKVTKGESCLSKEDVEEINKIITNYNNVLNEARTRFHQFPKFADPPMKYEDVEKAINELTKVNFKKNINLLENNNNLCRR